MNNSIYIKMNNLKIKYKYNWYNKQCRCKYLESMNLSLNFCRYIDGPHDCIHKIKKCRKVDLCVDPLVENIPKNAVTILNNDGTYIIFCTRCYSK
jgi:hypothetical protein